MNLLGQPAIVADVLDEVCQGRETLSAVTLALALVDRGRLSENGDPVGLVSTVIEELGEAGLVKYRLRHEGSNIPLHIRATPSGYKVAGYERETKEVGSPSAKWGVPRQKGPTDFRSQPQTTWGDAIERMSLSDHLDLYPEHVAIHPHPWECGPYLGEPMSNSPEAMARRKKARTDKIVQAIVALGDKATFSRLVEVLDVSRSVVSRYLDDARSEGLIERIGEANANGTYWRLTQYQFPDEGESARQAILAALADGPADTDHELMIAIAKRNPTWRRLGAHSLDHQLFSMEKLGLIDMDVKRAGSVQQITNIRLGRIRRERTDQATLALKRLPIMPVTEPLTDTEWEAIRTDPIDNLAPTILIPDAVVADGTFGNEGDNWDNDVVFPILASLLERASRRDETSRRVDAYLAAASALDGVAQEESDRLMALASDLDDRLTLTDVEAEYLRFAKSQEESNG
jgi:DNA-binding transcriptional ArsR family regulator